jgi:hypothetical protein
MNHTLLFTILTAGLVLNTGCGKKEKEESSAPSPSSPPESSASIQEKMTAPLQKTVTATKETIEETTQKVIQQTKETVQSYTVKAEDILNEMSEPVAAVKEKISTYSQPELLARANQYKTTILDQTEQLTGLTEQLKDLPATALFGEKGKALKDQVSKYTQQLSALKERYGIYIEKLKALGVSIPGLTL